MGRTSRSNAAFTLVELMIVVGIIGILSVLGIYGVRKYVSNSKTAEARNSLGQIAKDAATAFEKDAMASAVLAASAGAKASHALCASAGQTVPATKASIKGMKYQSDPTVGKDWGFDASKNAGFACMKFSMTAPQYFLYNYTSDGDVATQTTGTFFSATANGDLNGDGLTSTFLLSGTVNAAGNALFVAPNFAETAPEE